MLRSEFNTFKFNTFMWATIWSCGLMLTVWATFGSYEPIRYGLILCYVGNYLVMWAYVIWALYTIMWAHIESCGVTRTCG